MGRYTGPVCKLCRREGEKLFLKGERCFTPKCAIDRRSYAPGMHGRKSQYRKKTSDYAIQLREKQKARRIYSVMERQFRRYFQEAEKATGMTGITLLSMLERRLDNVVHRLGFASSRAQARQLVRHGHFEVNGHKTNIPSYLVKPGDEIRVRDTSRKDAYFQGMTKALGESTIPNWLSLDAQNLSGRVVDMPAREDVGLVLSEQLIVEYYSR